MDLISLWNQTVHNVAESFEKDDKEKKLVMMIGSQVNVLITGRILTFQFKSSYAYEIFPDYLSAFFKEFKRLSGIQELTIKLQDPNQSVQPAPAPAPAPQYTQQPSIPPYSATPNYAQSEYGQAPYQQGQMTFAGGPVAQKNTRGISPSRQPAATQQLPKFMREDRINPDKTFENYVTDPVNSLIFAIAKKIAAAPGETTTNPFYIYGASGLGKTHLLFAIANEIRRGHPEKTLVYLRAEEFIHFYVNAMSNRNSYDSMQVNFQDLFTSRDVFIVDDIQNFIKAEKSRDTFFEIIADFIDRPNRQLILASDVPPGNLKGFNQRLISRFGSGVCREIYPPDTETRAAITKSKCREFHVNLPDNIVQYIATNIRSNVREIEGAIKTLQTHIMTYNGITYDDAVKTLSVLVNNKNQITTVEKIKDRVAKEFEVTVSSMESAERKKKISMARSMAMTLASDLIPGLSLNDIGREFNKDHSSVHDAIKRTRQRIAEDPEYSSTFQRLTLSLKKE